MTSSSMTREAIVRMTHDWFERVWNQRDDSAIDEMMAEDVWIDGFDPNGERVFGREVFKQGRQEYLAIFPDLVIAVDHVAVDDNQSIAWLTCTSTCDPIIFGISGSPKQVTFNVVAWAELENGKFVGGRNLIDFGAVMRAFQAMP